MKKEKLRTIPKKDKIKSHSPDLIERSLLLLSGRVIKQMYDYDKENKTLHQEREGQI